MRPTCLAPLGSVVTVFLALAAAGQVSQETLESLSTADRVDTSIGTLEFKDGAPSAATAQTVSDALDFTRALNVYNNSFRGASAYAIREGLLSIGADDNDVVIFSELMDASALFLTANGVARGNWIRTDPDKGWFTILRLYSPLPSFFDKSWRPSEIEPVP